MQLDAATGSEHWRFKAGDDPELHNQVGFQSSPVVIQNTVYVGGRDARVYALDASSGKKKWDYYTNRTWVSATPVVKDNRVYATADKTFVLDAKSGRLILYFEKSEWTPSTPAIGGHIAYTGQFNGRLYATDIHTGKHLWEFVTNGAKADRLGLLNSDGSLKQGAMSPVFFDFQDDYINMFKRYSIGAIIASPVIQDDELYFGSTDGYFYALH